MREQAGQGEPLLLTDGLGNVWGKWCIKSIDETHSDLMANGAPRHIRFRLELVEYGEDRGKTGIGG